MQVDVGEASVTARAARLTTGAFDLTEPVRALRPDTMFDDGVHTFIEWPAEAALPAVFSIDHLGREGVINGAMRGRFYVLDSVNDHLLFRIDKNVARAHRALPKRRRGQ